MKPSEEDATEFVKNSALYKEFFAEREEILRHKWIESEKEQFKAEEFPNPNSSSRHPRFQFLNFTLCYGSFKSGTYLQDFPRVTKGLKQKTPHGSE